MNKLNQKQKIFFKESKPYKNLNCKKCKGKLIYISKDFINGGGKVCDRCLFYYKSKTCKKCFNIYSDGEEHSHN